MNRFNVLLFMGLMCVVATAGAANAETIAIGNADFESPAIANPPYIYGQIYDQAEFYLMAPWVLWQSALTNPAMLDAALPGNGFGIDMTGHGAQIGYLFCGDPNASNKPYWYQNLSATFEAGKEYTLSMDAAMVETAANPGQTLELRLGYWPETPDPVAGPTVIAQKHIAYDEITSSWGNYSIASAAVSGDAVGKNIVVYIAQGDNPYVTGPQYYIDNAQLTAVPEPGTVILLTSGLLGLAVCVWRKRK
jgi:hypothetical protein